MRLVSFSWAAERPLSHVVGIGRHWTIPPQPTHHLGHDRATEFLTVKIHAPGVVDVIAFLRQSLPSHKNIRIGLRSFDITRSV